MTEQNESSVAIQKLSIDQVLSIGMILAAIGSTLLGIGFRSILVGVGVGSMFLAVVFVICAAREQVIARMKKI